MGKSDKKMNKSGKTFNKHKLINSNKDSKEKKDKIDRRNFKAESWLVMPSLAIIGLTLQANSCSPVDCSYLCTGG